MDDAEFQAQVDQLPPGMRFVVRHVVTLSLGVIVLFGGLLVAVLVVHSKASSVIAVFCVVAIVMALGNLTAFRFARRKATRSR
jgi:hypothetical protein